MPTGRIPASVRNALGDEATFGLIELLNAEEKEWGDRVLTTAVDRFEVRLTRETGLLRDEMHAMERNIRTDLATTKVEILRWSFLFWIGQVAAIAALLSFMLRAGGR